MGSYLSTPKTEKLSEDGHNEQLKYGVSAMQGWRNTMEDAVSFSNFIPSHHLFCLSVSYKLFVFGQGIAAAYRVE